MNQTESILLAIEAAGWTWRLAHTNQMPELAELQRDYRREWTLHVERSDRDHGTWRRFTGTKLTPLLAEALTYVEREVDA